MQYPRLSNNEREEALADYEANTGRPGDDILYRDDMDNNTTVYQVVDAQGRGDGSGTWTPIRPKPKENQ